MEVDVLEYTSVSNTLCYYVIMLISDSDVVCRRWMGSV